MIFSSTCPFSSLYHKTGSCRLSVCMTEPTKRSRSNGMYYCECFVQQNPLEAKPVLHPRPAVFSLLGEAVHHTPDIQAHKPTLPNTSLPNLRTRRNIYLSDRQALLPRTFCKLVWQCASLPYDPVQAYKHRPAFRYLCSVHNTLSLLLFFLSFSASRAVSVQ